MARGHLKERAPGVFTLVVELEKDPVTGKRRSKWVTFKGTKRAAEKKLAELVADANRGKIAPPNTMTVAEWLERWHSEYQHNLAQSTAIRYKQIIEYYLAPHLNNIKLTKLTPLDIVGLYGRLRDVVAFRRQGKPLSPTTIQHAHGVLHLALETAVKFKLLADNPASRVDKPRRDKREMQYYNTDEIKRLLVACREDTYWQAFFLVAVTTGLRLGEMAALTWADVEFDKQVISVSKTVRPQSRAGLLRSTGKTENSRRVVAISNDVVSALQRHRTGLITMQLACKNWQNNNLVFPGVHGQPLPPTNAKRALARYSAAAGIPLIPLHGLRHSSATLALEVGIHPKVVSERLGHANVSITLNLYSHVSKSMQQQAAEVMERAVHPLENR